MAIILSMLVVAVVAFFARAQGQGYLITLGDGAIYMVPISVTQCETVPIFYNTIGREPSFVTLSTVDGSADFLIIPLPSGTGYLDWICNIPSGELFSVFGEVNYAVQPGSSSACLGNLTTTYPLAPYETAIFESYTATTPSYTSLFQPSLITISTYPTGSFTTITINPNIGVVSTSFTTIPSATASSTTIPSATASSTSLVPLLAHKSNGRVIAGAVVGVVIFLVILTLILFYWRKSRKSAGISLPVESDPTMSAINQLEFPYAPPPLPESTEYVHRHPFLQPNAGINQTKPLPNAPPTTILEPLIPTYTSPEISSSRSKETPSDLSATLDVVSHAIPSQRQAFLSSQNASANVVGDASPQSVPIQTPPHRTSMTDAQNHPPDLTTVLGVLSDAHLTQRERQIVASFTNSLAANPSAPVNLTRENTTSSPPRYSA